MEPRPFFDYFVNVVIGELVIEQVLYVLGLFLNLTERWQRNVVRRTRLDPFVVLAVRIALVADEFQPEYPLLVPVPVSSLSWLLGNV